MFSLTSGHTCRDRTKGTVWPRIWSSGLSTVSLSLIVAVTNNQSGKLLFSLSC